MKLSKKTLESILTRALEIVHATKVAGDPTLKAAFARVEDARHWKNPIDRVVALPVTGYEEELAGIVAAIIFFTGSVADLLVERKNEIAGLLWVRVRAAGYYATIGA